METNEQYALYDGDSEVPKKWVAHVRLTPELLQHLRENPDAVTLQLQAPGASSKNTRANSESAKLCSAFTVCDSTSGNAVRYDMLSFTEDPTTNVLGVLRTDDESEATTGAKGFAFREVGRVHQKLIVQRMLDSTEKDRMKDKHAKSVIESKSRSSKLLSAEREGESKPPVASRAAFTRPQEIKEQPEKKRRRLPSSLTEERAQVLRERIMQPNQRIDEDSVEGDGLFSTDSEVDMEMKPSQELTLSHDESTSPPKKGKLVARVTQAVPKKRKAVPESKTKPVKKGNPAAESPGRTAAPERSEAATESQADLSQLASKILKSSSAAPAEGKKRARPRVNRLPDLSFLPSNVQEICKRMVSHINRTTILDDTDYESYVAEHHRLRDEWEQLDKAYSIESILIDGAHFQLPFAVDDDERSKLEAIIRASESRHEGLVFLRDTMSTIHKTLASLQASTLAYESKHPRSDQ